MRTGIGLILLGLVLAGGCDGATRAASDGVAVPHWSLQLQTRIGSIDDPDVGLTRVTQVAFGPGERLYVAQSVDREIRVYDPAGGLVRRIGREGEGPGEFRSIGAIGFLHDTLTVSDASRRRFNLFTSDGGFIESFQWASKTGEMKPPVFYVATVPEVLLEDGTGLLHQSYGFMMGVTGEISIPWLRIDRSGTRQDTLVVQPYPIGSSETVTVRGIEAPVWPPFEDAPLYELMADGGGIAIIERPAPDDAAPPAFRLLRIDPDGDTILARSYAYSPVAIPPDEVERQLDRYVEQYSDLPEPPGREEFSRIFHQPGFIPAYLPPVTSLVTGQDGTVWIRREEAERVRWDAIDESGEMTGEIELPRGSIVMAAKGGLLAVLEQDELDVPWVLVYRIDRSH